jgi:hypothetical protein
LLLLFESGIGVSIAQIFLISAIAGYLAQLIPLSAFSGQQIPDKQEEFTHKKLLSPTLQ